MLHQGNDKMSIFPIWLNTIDIEVPADFINHLLLLLGHVSFIFHDSCILGGLGGQVKWAEWHICNFEIRDEFLDLYLPDSLHIIRHKKSGNKAVQMNAGLLHT